MSAQVPAPPEVQDLSERVELELARRYVADAHRARAAVALQIQLLLDDPPLPADPEQHLQVLRVTARAAHDEMAKTLCLVVTAELGKCVRRERRVPDPAVPVVPVALPTERLRQRRGRGGDDRT